MKENLIRLHNTLGLIETRGESTKVMAQCLQFVEQMVMEIDAQEPVKQDVQVEA